MKSRLLGRTGLSVSEVGLGAWQLGQASKVSAADARALVHRALDLGINLFDTAPNYGDSEELLGKALAGQRDRVVLCTKFGHTSDGEKNFDPALLRSSVERSLRRLRTDHVDLVLLHNPPRGLLDGADAIYEQLTRLRTEGKLRCFGSSLDFSAEMQTVMNTRAGDVMEVLFNVFHQEPRQAFEQAENAGFGVIVKVPLDSGWLSGRYNRNSRFNDIRSRWTPKVIEQRCAFLDQVRFMAGSDTSLVQAALRFVLAHRAVSAVIPGATSIAQLEENASASDEPMPAEHVARLHQLYGDAFKDGALPW